MQKIIIKNDEQVGRIYKSCQLAASILERIAPYVKPGVTTLEINDLIEKWTQEAGATSAPLNYEGYPKSVCTSINEVVCHGIPEERVLKNGDIVNIDVSTILDGYYGDTSRMYAVGNISEEAIHLLKVAKRCLEIGIEQVRPGKKTGEIGHYISQYAVSQNCSVVKQFGGHGTGFFFFMNHLIFLIYVIRMMG